MQIVVSVLATSSIRRSLREIVITDLQKHDYGLEVIREKKIGRPKGWAKIKAKRLTGVLNMTWHANSKVLSVRAVGKEGNVPDELVARFLGYLLRRRRRDFDCFIVRSM